MKLKTGAVTFDAEALEAIAGQADGENLTFSLNDGKVTELTGAQQEAVGEMEVLAVVDACITSGGQLVSEFHGGSATVSVPCALKEGQTARGLVVWYSRTISSLTTRRRPRSARRAAPAPCARLPTSTRPRGTMTASISAWKTV